MVVGDKGTILRTDDAGANWTPQKSGTSADLHSVFLAADGKRGWAVGHDDAILRTVDAGTSWTNAAQEVNAGSDLRSVVFAIDGERGLAVGSHGVQRTDDAGASWTLPDLDTSAWLFSAFFATDGKRGWAVGDNGTITRTEDGGATWTVKSSGTNDGLRGVYFSADGKRGWAVGFYGTILRTDDDGTTWSAQKSDTNALLTSVYFSTDGKRGWAVGEHGTILTTSDGGQRWSPINLYRRSPAPAFYFLLCFAAVPLGFAIRRPPEPPAESRSIANIYISDAALSAEQAAGTQVGAVAAGLASYLENPKTQAPLVIGITGPWGSGKSSLMGILRDHLKERGFQTAWFNAWHHQNKEHLFASLLACLRGRALPAWWTPRGWAVRWRLLLERCQRMWLRLLLGLAGVTFICVVAPQLDLNLDMEWKLENVVGVLALPAALVPVVALWKVFSAFGVGPSKLVESLRGPSAAKAHESTSLRERFAEEFGEVTRALQPRPLTLFIDDLDRCHPEQMFAALEAVNFLASSGACYVVLGMEQQVVLHCLEDKLKDLPVPAGAAPGADASATLAGEVGAAPAFRSAHVG